MNTKKLVTASLFLAMGYILHMLIPGLPLGSMKPDPFLTMLFLAVAVTDDFKSSLIIGLAAGLLTALTTTFPMGQIPNLIDKTVTAPAVYLLYSAMRRQRPALRLLLIAPLGTLLSGTLFLFSAQLFFDLPLPFSALFFGVVLPAAVSNTILTALVGKAMVRTRPLRVKGQRAQAPL